MSKRLSNNVGGEERYGGMDDPRDAPDDPPQKATAAQLARRKMAAPKGRLASRSASPSKGAHSFAGVQSFGGAPAGSGPPSAASFAFGSSGTQNPFATMSQAEGNQGASRSFPGSASPSPAQAPSAHKWGAAAPVRPAGANGPVQFALAAVPKPAGANGPISFGGAPQPAEQKAPAASAFSFGASTENHVHPFGSLAANMRPSSHVDSNERIRPAEIQEIEDAGPRLTAEGRLHELANIVRNSDHKYKYMDLAGLNVASLPPIIQRRLLAYVRGQLNVGSDLVRNPSESIVVCNDDGTTKNQIPSSFRREDAFNRAKRRLVVSKLVDRDFNNSRSTQAFEAPSVAPSSAPLQSDGTGMPYSDYGNVYGNGNNNNNNYGNQGDLYRGIGNAVDDMITACAQRLENLSIQDEEYGRQPYPSYPCPSTALAPLTTPYHNGGQNIPLPRLHSNMQDNSPSLSPYIYDAHGNPVGMQDPSSLAVGGVQHPAGGPPTFPQLDQTNTQNYAAHGTHIPIDPALLQTSTQNTTGMGDPPLSFTPAQLEYTANAIANNANNANATVIDSQRAAQVDNSHVTSSLQITQARSDHQNLQASEITPSMAFTPASTSTPAPSSTPAPAFGGFNFQSAAPALDKPANDFSATSASGATSAQKTSTPAASTSQPVFSFGQQAATPASAPAVENVQAAASTPAKPVFSFGQQAATPATAPAVENVQAAASTPAKPVFSFGQQAATPATAPAVENVQAAASTPAKPVFSFAKPDAQASATPAKPASASVFTPKPDASSVFSFGNTNAQAATTPAPKPTAEPATVPAKPTFSFGQIESQPGSSTPAAKTASQPDFGFTKPNADPATSAPASKPMSLASFAAPSPAEQTAHFQATASKPMSLPNFAAPKPAEQTAPAQKPATPFTAPATPKPVTSTIPPSPASQNSFTPSKPAAQAAFTPAKPNPASGPASDDASIQSSAERAQSIRELNVALRKHINSADPDQDWGNAMLYFLELRSNLMSTTSDSTDNVKTPKQPSFSASSNQGQKRKPEDEPSDVHGDSKRSKSNFSPAKPFSDTANVFNDILNTPQKEPAPKPVPTTQETPKANPSNGLAKATQAAPQEPKPTASAETPKANPFANLPKSGNSPTRATPKANPSANIPKSASNPPTSAPLFKAPSAAPATASEPVKDASKPAPAASPFQFKPSTTASSAPATGGFQIPASAPGAASGASFFAAFGQKAAAEEAKQREKRKLEDLDSDDDEAEWEKKDAEEQAAKRAKLLANASKVKFVPGKGFVTDDGGDTSEKSKDATSAKPASESEPAKSDTTPAAAQSHNIFGHLAGKQSEEAEEEEPDTDDDEGSGKAAPASDSNLGKSLFDRIEKPAEDDKPSTASVFGGSANPFSASTTSNVFGASTAGGDQTWKGAESTPIKFGSFGASANTKKPTDGSTTTPEGSPAKQAFAGFSTSNNAPPKFNFSATSVHDQTAMKDSNGKPASPGFKFAAPSSNPTPSADTRPFAGLFGGPAKSGSDAGDKSPKPAAAANTTSVFSSIQGNNKPSSSSVGFTFGTPSAGTSALPSGTSSVFASTSTTRAGSPATGTATDTEATDENQKEGEPSDVVPTGPQIDLSNLTKEEMELNELLFEQKSKAYQLIKSEWKLKGLGILRLLKSKDDGRVFMSLKAQPSGKLLLNTGLVGAKDMYKLSGKRLIMPVAEKGVVGNWYAVFGKEESAAEAFRVIQEYKDKQ